MTTSPHAGEDAPILTRDFILVCTSTLFYFVAFLFYFPTLPTFIKRLGGDESDIGLLIAVSSLTALAVRPFVGQFIDALGSRRTVIAGAALYVFVTAAYNLADSQALLIVVRALNGLALAAFATATSAYVADIAPVARRGEAMGYYGLANNLAFAIGPLVAVAVMDASWLRDADSAITDRAGWLAGAGVEPENFTLVFLSATAFAVLSTLLAMRMGDRRSERVRPTRLVWSPGELFTRAAVFPAAVNYVQSFAFATLVTFVALFAKDQGFSGGGRYFFLIYAAAIMAMRVIGGRVSDRYGRGAMIVPGLAMLALALLLTGFAENEAMFWSGAALYGLGAGASQPALMALAVDVVRPEERGRAMGTFTLSGDLGLSSGALILGFVLEHSNYEAMYAVAAAVVATGVAGYLIGSPRFGPRRAALEARTEAGSPAS